MMDSVLADQADRNSMHGLRRRKALGAFYTPDLLSQVLADWGIRQCADIVIEPSFGGCTFLEAISNKLGLLACSSKVKNVFGCDIDIDAFNKLKGIQELGYSESNFHFKDFLKLDCSDIPSKADLVIGNPPYIRHSHFSVEQRQSIETWREKYQVTYDARSSLWVHFVLHSLNFLKENGRLAFVLPGSFLSADYSKNIHETLNFKFSRVLAISLSERIFLEEGAEERSVILLCDGFRAEPNSSGEMHIVNCSSLSEVNNIVKAWPVQDFPFRNFGGLGATSCVESSSIEDFLAVSAALPIKQFGHLASINIGIVTGDTKYFIRTASDWAERGITRDHLRFVVPKVKDIPGIHLTPSQCQRLVDSGVRCLLLDTDAGNLPYPVLHYLNSYDEEKIRNLATFKKRGVWHQPDDHKQPDGFLSFLTHNGPRLIVNSARVNSTNSVHRVFLNLYGRDVGIKLISISLLSSYSQLHAEIIGRICGSGALKLEPKDALRLQLIVPQNIDRAELLSLFSSINRHMKKENFDEQSIRQDVDDFFDRSLNLNGALSRLGVALHRARSSRRGERLLNI